MEASDPSMPTTMLLPVASSVMTTSLDGLLSHDGRGRGAGAWAEGLRKGAQQSLARVTAERSRYTDP
ncbi:hypothetical protein GCM10010252_76880 [Streptomyces aureoverticillatus]|nr:hypothetical protein GCM10010252_76880 [Streptomyces aureoverticillatus]